MSPRKAVKPPVESPLGIIVILLIAIAVAGIIYYESIAGDTVTSMVTVPPNHGLANIAPASSGSGEISTLGWSTISEGGYTIEYPADFVLKKLKTSVELSVPIKSYFNTILPDEVYFTLNAPAKKCPASVGDSVISSSTIDVGGVSFLKNEWYGVGAGQLYRGFDYMSVKNGLCYEISIFTHSANGAGFYFNNQTQIDRTDAQHAVDMKAFFELSDKILSTFTFNQ